MNGIDADACIAFAASRGVALRRAGKSLRGRCPFHRGDNPTSFSVTPGVAYHCFACGAAGGVRQLGGVEPSAVGVPKDLTGGRTTEDRIVRSFYGLDPAHPYLLRRGVDPTTARHFGIGVFRGTGAFARRAIVPLHDVDGTLIGHIGRAIDDREPRYLVQRGTPTAAVLFNAHRTRWSERVIVVEGVFDALAVHALGVANVVALLGAQASRTQLDHLRRYPSVTILLDGDAAGRAGARRLAGVLGPSASVLSLPESDPAGTAPDALHTLLAPHST